MFLFCAFEGPPKIVRLHGRGTVVEPAQAGFEELAKLFGTAPFPVVRSVLRVELERISDSCGFGVPQMRFAQDRPQLHTSSARLGRGGMVEFQRKKNLAQHRRPPGPAQPARSRRERLTRGRAFAGAPIEARQ